jgi:cell division septation protein DedD
MTDDDTGGDATLDSVALPIKVPREVAVTIMEELEEGRAVEAEFDPERMPHLADRIRWQLEHERLVTEFVPEYEAERGGDGNGVGDSGSE